MKTPTKTKTRIHDNWLAGYSDLPVAGETSTKSPKGKSSKGKSSKKNSSKTKIYARLNSRPT